tara:strand:+ start:647 stop:1480 length:834 start_codon:yes stop_codon:yes gene_type:complete
MGFIRQLTGKDAAKAAVRAGDLQSGVATENAAQLGVTGQEQIARLEGSQANQLAELDQGNYRANRLLDPYAQLGQQGVEQAGFLTDPNAQFDFLQNNPLFQMGLDNANTQTAQMAASRGRLSAGDTLQQFNQNSLLTAAPLIAQQRQAIQNQLTMGGNAAINQSNLATGLAGQRADVIGNTAINQANMAMGNQANIGNLLGSAAAAEAAGMIGYANAKQQGAAGIVNLGAQIAGGFMGGGGGGGAVPPPSMPGGGFGSNLNLSSQPVFDSTAWGTYP